MNEPGENQELPTDRRATGRDVAQLAGVSQPTVSRVLRGYTFVSADTRDRVLRAASDLGYSPRFEAKPPVSVRPEQIGIVSTDWDSPFYPHLVAPMQRALSDLGYNTVLFTENVDETLLLRRLVDDQFGGVIFTSSNLESSIPRDLSQKGVPIVLTHRAVDGIEADSCTIDNYFGGRLVANSLIEENHHRVAVICGPQNTNTGRDRAAGFTSRFLEHGYPIPEDLVHWGPYSYDTGYAETERILATEPEVTAIFCANDVIALGARSCAVEMGLRVPHDLSIVGFDDSPIASWGGLELTTVNCNVSMLAERSVAMLLERIADPSRTFQRVIVQPTLVRRSTLAPPRTNVHANYSGMQDSR